MGHMKRILLVDDKPKNLEDLKLTLCPQDQWVIAPVPDGEAALAALETGPFDVIVTDMRTAGVNGTSLLSCVQRQFPEVVRIGISQQMKTPLQVSMAHQILPAPCDSAKLRVAVERSCKLKDLLNGEAICRTVGALGELPSIPKVYQELTQALEKPDIALNEVATIVEQDIAISAKLLQLGNSAIFQTTGDFATIKAAVSYLGLNMIKNMVLSMEVFRVFDGAEKIAGFSLEALQSHGQLVAKIVAQLPLAKQIADTAIVAALLHDIGKLVLAWKMPRRFARFRAVSREENRPLYQVEEELWGITHAEIGAYLLGLWGLPQSITEAVAYHHAPTRVPHLDFDAVGAVYVANLLAHGQANSAPDHILEAHAEMDLPFLQDLGLIDQLSGWQAMAKQMACA